MINKNISVWVLSDNRPGNTNQSLGVAESLGYKYEIKNISYNIIGKLPNFIRKNSLLGVSKQKSSNFAPPFPDIAIAAGRKLTPILQYIKKNSNNTITVQLMWPGAPYNYIDIIAIPKHDGVKNLNNVIYTFGAPNRINKELLEKESKNNFFSGYKKPIIGLLLGGDTKQKKFSDTAISDFVESINNIIKSSNASVIATSSRRTPEKLIQSLKDSNQDIYLYEWEKENDFNPYTAILANADYLVVTGDSVSMCSEACSTGKPVFIYDHENITTYKMKKFIQELFKTGYAKPLSKKEKLDSSGFSGMYLSDAQQIVKKINSILTV